jgi:hypothetical protein
MLYATKVCTGEWCRCDNTLSLVYAVVLVLWWCAGQPVLIGGTMGTCSYVLTGTDKGLQETFGSTCHGAGEAPLVQ